MLPPITVSTKRLTSMKIGAANPFVHAQQKLIREKLEHMETSLRERAETRMDKLMSELDGGVTSNGRILIENAKAELHLEITRETTLLSTRVTEAESANAALQEEVAVLKAQLAMHKKGWAEGMRQQRVRDSALLQGPGPSVGELQQKATALTKHLDTALKGLGDLNKKRSMIRLNAFKTIERIQGQTGDDPDQQSLLVFLFKFVKGVDDARETAYASRVKQALFMQQMVIDTVQHTDNVEYTSIDKLIDAEKIKHTSTTIEVPDLVESIKRLGYIKTAVDAQLKVVLNYIDVFTITTVKLVDELESETLPAGGEGMLVMDHNQLVEKKIVERAQLSIDDRLRDLYTILRDDWFYVSDKDAKEAEIADLEMRQTS